MTREEVLQGLECCADLQDLRKKRRWRNGY